MIAQAYARTQFLRTPQKLLNRDLLVIAEVLRLKIDMESPQPRKIYIWPVDPSRSYHGGLANNPDNLGRIAKHSDELFS